MKIKSKKILALIGATALMVGSLIGCGNTDATTA